MANEYQWKAEVLESMKNIHPENVPKWGKIILHFSSRVLLVPRDDLSEKKEFLFTMEHNDNPEILRGFIAFQKDKSFRIVLYRHDSTSFGKYVFPMDIWEETEKTVKEIFETAGWKITEYDEHRNEDGEKRITGKYTTKS